jgi:hypothetical protein
MLIFDTFFGAAVCATLLAAVHNKSAVLTVRARFEKIGFMGGGIVDEKA